MIGDSMTKYITFVTSPRELKGFDGFTKFRIAYRKTVLILREIIVL